MTDRGARALAERLDGIGAGPDGCEFSLVLDVDTGRMDDLHHGPEYADAILANGAVFLPNAAELERLRRIEAAARASMTAWTGMRAEATKFKVWSEADETIYQSPVQSDLRAALEPEGSAPDGG